MMRALATALLFAAVGCDPPTSVVPTASAPSATASAEPPITDPGVFVSKRFGMRLKLPRSAGWKIDDTKSRWLSATHGEDGSSLLVRLFRDENRMNREKCEVKARSFRALPKREGAEIMAEELVDVPAGFDTRADVGVLTDGKGGLFGFILAFGGSGRECFAYVYVTRAEGIGSDAVVADRLAEMMEGSLRALAFDSNLRAILERDAASPLPE